MFFPLPFVLISFVKKNVSNLVVCLFFQAETLLKKKSCLPVFLSSCLEVNFNHVI